MGDLITKDNQVIKASYRLSPNEQAVILYALSKVQKDETLTDQTLYDLDVNHLAKMTGSENSSRYTLFKEACLTLFDRKLMIHNGSKKLTRWVQTIDYEDGKGVIKIRFSTDIVPYLSNLKANFTVFNLKDVIKFKSSYSLRVYEHIKQWSNTKKSINISIDEIIERFDLPDSYRRVASLKERVIETAKKEINAYSDIKIDYENIKQGRKIVGFKFTWEPNKTKNNKKIIDQKSPSTRQINHKEKAKQYEATKNPTRKGGYRKEDMKKALQGKI